MPKVQKTSNDQLIITIPKKIAEFKDIDKGTKIVFKEGTKNTLILQIEK